MAEAVNTIGQSKRGGGDRSSRPAQLQARENEQKALSLWIKDATFQQIAAAGERPFDGIRLSFDQLV